MAPKTQEKTQEIQLIGGCNQSSLRVRLVRV